MTSSPPPFGIDAFEGYERKADGTPYTHAGGHAFAVGNEIDFNTHLELGAWGGSSFPVEPPKDVPVDVAPGLLGNPHAVGYCSAAELAM